MNPTWVPILCYHRICPLSDFGSVRALCVTPERFRSQMRLLRTLGYTALTVHDLVACFHLRKPIASKSVVITFDDGYEDNFTHAYPILQAFELTATIFLVTDLIGKVNAWDQEQVPLLKTEQIRQMSDGGITFGSHTSTHIDLSKGSAEQVRTELQASRKTLEEITSRSDTPFCYPYGRLTEDAKRMVRAEQYVCGVALDSGPWDQAQDLFELRRVPVFPGTSLFGFWRRVQPWYPRWAELRRKLQFKKKRSIT
jgi:peptidoglycan/xylan/chitin deacetylase (PgdA/CDA1 family)